MEHSDTTDGWRTLDDPRLQLTLRYPDTTPRGRPARLIQNDVEGGGVRAHVLSEQRERELYVEVVRFPPMSAEEEHARHREYLEQRFGAGSVTDLRDARAAGRPARAYSFRWPEGERVALLLRTDAALYRIIYNSASPLNEQVVETIRLRE